MSTGGTRPGIPKFRTARARERFLRGYRAAFALWPPHEALDVGTRYGRTRVYRHGPAHGDPIVLLHGTGANASVWHEHVAALAAAGPVYAVDAIDDPGGGEQTRALTGSADYAAWLDDVLGGLGLDRVHLVGHSYGGWLAMNQAARSAGRLASITALDPAGIETIGTRFLVWACVGLPRGFLPGRRRFPRLARWTAHSAYLMDWRVLGPSARAMGSFLPQRTAGRRYDDDELSAITVPSLFLLGGRSALFNAETARARVLALMPNARVEIFPEAGHGLPAELPDEVNTRILAHIGGPGTPGVPPPHPG